MVEEWVWLCLRMHVHNAHVCLRHAFAGGPLCVSACVLVCGSVWPMQQPADHGPGHIQFLAALACAGFVIPALGTLGGQFFLGHVLPTLLDWLHTPSLAYAVKMHLVRTMVRGHDSEGSSLGWASATRSVLPAFAIAPSLPHSWLPSYLNHCVLSCPLFHYSVLVKTHGTGGPVSLQCPRFLPGRAIFAAPPLVASWCAAVPV